MENKFKVVGYKKKNLFQKMDFSILMLIFIVMNTIILFVSNTMIGIVLSIRFFVKRIVEQDKMQRKKQ